MSSKLISAYGCMDFSSYFQAGSESRSVGLGLSRRPPGSGQAPLAALRGSLGLDSCPTWQMCIYITCCGRAVCLDLLNEYFYYYYYLAVEDRRFQSLHRKYVTFTLQRHAVLHSYIAPTFAAKITPSCRSIPKPSASSLDPSELPP